MDAPTGCCGTGSWPGWVWPGPVSAGENGGEATCRNLPEQRPVGEMWARQLSSLGLPKGKVSMAIPGERSCLDQVETRARNDPGRGEAVEGVTG